MKDVERVVSSQQAAAVVAAGGAYVEAPNDRVPKMVRQESVPAAEPGHATSLPFRVLSGYRSLGYDPNDDAPSDVAVYRPLAASKPAEGSRASQRNAHTASSVSLGFTATSRRNCAAPSAYRSR